MKKDQVDLDNALVWIPDSKTPNGVAEAPLTPLAVQAFEDQLRIAGAGLFRGTRINQGTRRTLKTVWHKTLKRAKISYFRIYDLRSTYATRLSAGGVADESVTEMLRQGDAKVLQEVLADETAGEARGARKNPTGRPKRRRVLIRSRCNERGFDTFRAENEFRNGSYDGK